MNNDVFEDSEYLKEKIYEGRTCAVRGRKIYDLQLNEATGKVEVVLKHDFHNLPVPFTKNNHTYFVEPSEVGHIINNTIFWTTIRGFI